MRKCKACGLQFYTTDLTKELCHCCEEALKRLNGYAVPVVRCKDCKKGRPIDKTKIPEKYFRVDCVVCQCESVVGDEPMVYEPTHFCSYGERREGE